MKRLMVQILRQAAKVEQSAKKCIIRSSVKRAGVWFVDIPRTGSTSIKHDLVRRYGECFDKDFYREDAEGRKGKRRIGRPICPEAHSTAREMRRLLGAGCFDSLYTFSFVRNPLDRFHSLFQYRRMAGDLGSGVSFKRYACSLATPRFRDPDSPFYKRPYYLPMCDYLLDGNGDPIIDAWFKFEEREAALGRIGEETGIRFSDAHLESGKSLKSYTECYDAESAECVRTFYKDDFAYFSYDG